MRATSSSYPIARPLFMYTNGEPAGEIKKYLDWVLSDADGGEAEENLPSPSHRSGAQATNLSDPCHLTRPLRIGTVRMLP